MNVIPQQETVTLEHRGAVSVITLNRPDSLNAIDLDTHLLLHQRLVEADEHPTTRSVVITGSGRAFCAGGDVKAMKGKTTFGVSDRVTVRSPGKHLVDILVGMEKPTIAMVNGVAAGLGATIALFCDIVIMADEARIGDTHVKVGLVAGDGGAVIWPLLIGPSRAKRYLMTGEFISGTKAAEIGLVSESVPLAELEETAMKLAAELAALPPYALRATKISVNSTLASAAGQILEKSLAYEHLSMNTADHQEAVTAFLEKRAGVYTGR